MLNLNWRTFSFSILATVQVGVLRASDPALHIRLLKTDYGLGPTAPIQGRLTNLDRISVEVCADRKDPRFQGKRNPAISFRGAKNAGWVDPESVLIDIAIWRDGNALRPADFSLERDNRSLDPNRTCSTVDLRFPLPNDRQQNEEAQFWPKLIALLEGEAKTAEVRKTLDRMNQQKDAMMAYFRTSNGENMPGKYSLTAVIAFPGGLSAASTSENLSFEIMDSPGFYPWLLERMARKGAAASMPAK